MSWRKFLRLLSHVTLVWLGQGGEHGRKIFVKEAKLIRILWVVVWGNLLPKLEPQGPHDLALILTSSLISRYE